MRALILGAAAGGGLPQWNCGCANCAAARKSESGILPQTQSSVAVSADGETWAVLNASPDIRQQVSANTQLHPRQSRDSPVRSVLLTNGDIDHIAGLLTLRERQPLDIYMTAALADIIDGNSVFRVLDRDLVRRRVIRLNESFELLPGLQARLFPVPGKVPLFMEDGEPELGVEGEQTAGVELTCGERRAYYIPGCGAMTETLADRIRSADLVLFDGTLFTDDEMRLTGTGEKTSRRMGHMPIAGPDGSLQALAPLDIGRKLYIHINNTNPVWRPGPERETVERAGFEIGRDGMEIVI